MPQSIDTNLSVLSILLAGPFQVGTAIFFLNVARNKEVRIEYIFDGFKKYVPALVATLLIILVVGIGLVLLIIPGIIVALGLSQTFFILAEEEISGMDAMKKSWDMMDGYKMKFFLLNCLHFVMVIVGILMLIIGVFYMLPIIYTSLALFYDKLKKGELNQF